MPKSTMREVPPRASPAHRYRLTGGNGTPEPDSLPDRLQRMETLLESVQHQLAVQFQRTAELQVQLDRFIASQSKANP